MKRVHCDISCKFLKFVSIYLCRSLQWLRGSGKNVELELETIRNNIRTSRFNMENNMHNNLSSISHNGLPMKYSFKSIVKNVKSVLKNKRLVTPVLITCGLMIFQRFTGNIWLKEIVAKTIFFSKFLRCKLLWILCR